MSESEKESLPDVSTLEQWEERPVQRVLSKIPANLPKADESMSSNVPPKAGGEYGRGPTGRNTIVGRVHLYR